MKYSIQLLNIIVNMTVPTICFGGLRHFFILTADIFAKDSIMSDDIFVFPRECSV